MKHKSVLKKEAINLIDPKEGGIYADLTLGGGGHALELIQNLKSFKLVGFDLDKNNITEFINKLEGYKSETIGNNVWHLAKGDAHFYLVNDNFAHINDYSKDIGIAEYDGILADLGWSSDQLDSIPGLSYENSFDELDMRIGSNLGVKASDLLNALSKKELSQMFEKYSDIRGSQNERIVGGILYFRKKALFHTVGDLVSVIERSLNTINTGKRVFNNEKKYSDYSRVFQALRIAVNNEMQNLMDLIEKGYALLKVGGKFAVITFHSGEERLVSNYFKKYIEKQEAKYISQQYGENYTRPGVEELTENLRARSAKLSVIEKQLKINN